MKVNNALAFFAQLDFDELFEFLQQVNTDEFVSPVRYLIAAKECTLHLHVKALALYNSDKFFDICLCQHCALHNKFFEGAIIFDGIKSYAEIFKER